MTDTDSLAKVVATLRDCGLSVIADRIERLDAEMRKERQAWREIAGRRGKSVTPYMAEIADLRARLVACDPEWRSLYAIAGGAVCEARNVWSSEHEENWLETDENHPDDFVGRAVVDAIAAELQRRNIAAQSSAKGVETAPPE